MKIADAVCLRIYPIRLTVDGWEGMNLPVEVEQVAEEEGFASLADLLAWFDRHYGLPFDGVMIKWELTRPA